MLGVSRDVTPAEIHKAYRALLLALHPHTGAEPADPALPAQVVAAGTDVSVRVRLVRVRNRAMSFAAVPSLPSHTPDLMTLFAERHDGYRRQA